MIRVLRSRKNLVLDNGNFIYKIHSFREFFRREYDFLEEFSGELPVPKVLRAKFPILVLERFGGETLGDLLARGTVPDPEPFLSMIEEFHAITGKAWGDANPRNFILDGGIKIVDFEEVGRGPPDRDFPYFLTRILMMREEAFPKFLEAAGRYRDRNDMLREILGELELISFLRGIDLSKLKRKIMSL